MTISTNPVLSLEHVSMAYGRKQVLDDVSVTLNQGEVVCILGESGVGKTTLFNVIADCFTSIRVPYPYINKILQARPVMFRICFKKTYYCLIRPLSIMLHSLYAFGVSKVESREEALKYFVTFGLEGTEDLYRHSYREECVNVSHF